MKRFISDMYYAVLGALCGVGLLYFVFATIVSCIAIFQSEVKRMKPINMRIITDDDITCFKWDNRVSTLDEIKDLLHEIEDEADGTIEFSAKEMRKCLKNDEDYRCYCYNADNHQRALVIFRNE